jgi:hypothetical protein
MSTLEDVQIRAFSRADEESIRKKLCPDQDGFDNQARPEWHDLQQLMTEAALGNLRYTLPVLTYRGDVSIFPTLNVIVQRSSSHHAQSVPAHQPILEWEVCYKTIDQSFINRPKSRIEWRNAQVMCTTNEVSPIQPV